MKNRTINILVTGVGAVIGYGIIKSLKNSKYKCNIIGIDIFEDAIGQVWCDKFIQSIRADSSDFLNFINNIIEEEKIDLVLPGIEQDLQALIENFDKLNKNPKFSLNNRSLFKTLHDKKMTYEFFLDKIELIPHINYCDDLNLC